MIQNIETDHKCGYCQAAKYNEKTFQGYGVLEVNQQLLSSEDSVLLILLFAVLRSILDIFVIFTWLENVTDKLDSIILSFQNIIINNDGNTSISSKSNESRIIDTHIDSGITISLSSISKTKVLDLPHQIFNKLRAAFPCGFDLPHGTTFGILFCVFRI